MAGRAVPHGVRVVDFGIRGLDLAYALLDGYEAAILVDAAPRGGPPGTLYVIEPEIAERLSRKGERGASAPCLGRPSLTGQGADAPRSPGLVPSGQTLRRRAGKGRPVDRGPRHGPSKVLRLARPWEARLLASSWWRCEPATLGTDEEPVMGLSPPVEAAVEEAIPLIDSLVARLLDASIEYDTIGTSGLEIGSV